MRQESMDDRKIKDTKLEESRCTLSKEGTTMNKAIAYTSDVILMRTKR